MAEEMNRKDAAQEKLTDRNYVYVRYENDDDDEMDIYDIITLCKKGLLIAKRYIALLLVFFVLGGVVGFVKAKVFKEEKYTSTALLFVDLNRDVIDTSNDMNESSKISMLANSFSQIVSSDSVRAGQRGYRCGERGRRQYQGGQSAREYYRDGSQRHADHQCFGDR